MTAAQAFITYGAPAHRYETLIVAASAIFDLDAEFLVLPGCLLASFENPGTKSSISKMLNCAGGLTLGKLQTVYGVYWRVCHDEISAVEGTQQMRTILQDPPLYKTWVQTLLYFALAGSISALAFGGAFLDMCVAGCISAIITLVQKRITRTFWLTPYKYAL